MRIITPVSLSVFELFFRNNPNSAKLRKIFELIMQAPASQFGAFRKDIDKLRDNVKKYLEKAKDVSLPAEIESIFIFQEKYCKTPAEVVIHFLASDSVAHRLACEILAESGAQIFSETSSSEIELLEGDL